MFYWVIPYLVAYNLTEPTSHWKNGPVHTFEAEVNSSFLQHTEDEANYYADVSMIFECRPVNTSFIKCRVQNASMDNYAMMDNNDTRVGPGKSDYYEEFGGIDFHIEFDKTGIKNLTFPEPRGYFREMVIRAIFDSLNVGIDLTEKNFDHYKALDKSVYGDCPTSFTISKIAKRVEGMELSVKRDAAVRRLNIVPFPDEFSDDQTILIEKDRKTRMCLNKSSYIFGREEPPAPGRKSGLLAEFDTIRSKTEIYLGKNRFNSHSEQSGSYKIRFKSENSKNLNNKTMMGKRNEKIRLTLLSIRPDEA
ncbi:uncharacterized protein [Venturia canescens]|uniref:uncharacterized protein n=1 Tax=Venturia canescens TaxID=32260 RepID=UPI001C9CE816|nr:uncharacterized protein LOC122415048 [Venturia canescens]